MNAYLKTVGITLVAVVASAVVAARPAEPTSVVLPALTVTTLMQYLATRPYQEVAGIMSDLQRCLRDQVADDKGVVAERGNCPEIAVSLRQMKVPLVATLTPPKPSLTRSP